MGELVAAWIDAQIARLHVRRDAWVLGRERAWCLKALGAAVHEGREDEADRVKSRLAELDAGIAWARGELGRIDEWMHGRIAAARLEDGSTEQVPVPEPSPVPAPEPSPVPSDPPGPVIVPEPEPVPHEPPGPVIVPEPSPPAAL
jgi:hypothetical protein